MKTISINGVRVPMESQWAGRESALRDYLAHAYKDAGLVVGTEMRTVLDQRCDIAMAEPGHEQEWFAIVEVKVADPVRGIGQLFGYAVGHYPRPHLVLVADVAACNSTEMWACTEAGVEMWTARGEKLEHWGGPRHVWERVFGE